MAPPVSERKGHGGQLQDGPLKKAIDETFGGLDSLKKQFNATTAGIQGSGWGWVVRLPEDFVSRRDTYWMTRRATTRPPNALRSPPLRTRTPCSRTSRSSVLMSGSTRSTCST